MADTITYEQLQETAGQGKKIVDAMITYLLRKPATPGASYAPEDAFKVIVADVLLALGIEQVAVVGYLDFIGQNLSADERRIHILAATVHDQLKVKPEFPWIILQILEGRWALYPGKLDMFDLHTRIRVHGGVATPSLSTALNVTVLWMRTMPIHLGLDAAKVSAAVAGSAPGSGGEQTG